MDKENKRGEYNSYKTLLDGPLSKVKRRIANALTIAETTKEAQTISGAGERFVHKAMQETGLVGATASQLFEKKKIANRLLAELDAIIAKAPEAPLKYSDKLRAIEIRAELSGLGKANEEHTHNTVILDLRQSTEAELLAELASIEERQHSIIDATPVQQPSVQKDSTSD